MPRPKRNVLATAAETLSPPPTLPAGHVIARIVKAAGKNLYAVDLPGGGGGDTALVEMPARFRSTIWVKRGSFVVVDTNAYAERENKLGGEIANVVRDEKQWRRESYWPEAFAKSAPPVVDDDDSEEEEESNMGKMPPNDSDSES